MLTECGAKLTIQREFFMDTGMHHKILLSYLVLISTFHKWPSDVLLYCSFTAFLALGSIWLYLIFFVHEWDKHFIRLQGLCFIVLLCSVWQGQEINYVIDTCMFLSFLLSDDTLRIVSACNQISKRTIKAEFCLHPKRYFSETALWDQIYHLLNF